MLKKLFKKIKSVAGDIAPYAGLIASGFGLGPLYSTLIGAGVPLIAGKPDQALAGGLGGYFGGQTFGSKAAGTYVSPLDILKGSKTMVAGGPKGQMLKDARGLALDRLKGAAQFKGLKDDNPFKYAPGVFGGLAFAEGLGLFGDEEQPNLTANQFVYDPSQNVLPNMQQQFFNQASDFDVIPNVPGGIEEYLQSIGLLANGGRSFQDGDDTGIYNDMLGRNMTKDEMRTPAAPPPDPKDPNDMRMILNNMVFKRLNDPNRFNEQRSKYGENEEMLQRYRFNLDPDESSAIAKEFARMTGVTSDSPEFEEYMNIIYDESLMIGGRQDKERRKIFGLFAEGGVVGGDAINPIGGRIVGMGSGRQDLLEGEIVDPNTGQSQEIMVSNNEHVIPEFTLYALGGGDTEKGQQMMDDLRAKTKPMAKQMGYDFQGAEDGSMNYAPIMAQDGMETNGLQRMSENMQDGSMTADPMMMAGLGSVIKGLEDAQRLDRMTR
jgi:hypothetical protein